MTTQASEHVDAVVVGSGFGGSVSAYRLAEAGLGVVVLERGRAYPPGSFARSPADMSRNFWDPRVGLQGLFDVWSFRGFEAVVSAGLGGGSLIYANVLLRKDERWFVHEQPLPGGGYETWPISRADLEPHYDAVERMLRPSPYPFGDRAYASTPKTAAMREAAGARGIEWELPPLAVSFAPAPGDEAGIGLPVADAEYGNLHGVSRRTCRLCGECDLGCNDGSKNSLDHTYLSAAEYHGADIRTRSEVRTLRALPGGGYEVTYVEHPPEREGRRTRRDRLPSRTITCDRLILGAGAYGTTFLLLRNRATLPGLSDTLGTRYSGNGDLLAFLLPKDGGDRAVFDASRGPVITTSMRVPDEADGGGGRGHYVQDGGYPGFIDWVVESSNYTHVLWRSLRLGLRWAMARALRRPDSKISRELSRMIGDGVLSSGSLPMLGMGRDIPDGVMRLRRGLLDVDWDTGTSEEYFDGVRETIKELAVATGTEYHDNPMWFFKRVITVHPLGGAPMGRHEREGVCDPYGEVYGLPGLYIADGAAMPGPVGPNPSLTIAAHADRMATRMLE